MQGPAAETALEHRTHVVRRRTWCRRGSGSQARTSVADQRPGAGYRLAAGKSQPHKRKDSLGSRGQSRVSVGTEFLMGGELGMALGHSPVLYSKSLSSFPGEEKRIGMTLSPRNTMGPFSAQTG